MCLFGRTWHGAPIPNLCRPGSEGGDAGYGAVTAPSRPALMAGSGSCNRLKLTENLRSLNSPKIMN